MARGRPKKQESEPVIVVQNRRQKRRAEGSLSERRVIVDNKYKKKEEQIKFNMGLMPGNSWRCQDCRNGFAVMGAARPKCPNCNSTNLKPHSEDILV